jgi:hypothetical protein
MKRILMIVIGGVIVLAVLLQLVPYAHDHTNPPVKAEPQWPSPEVRTLAQRACFDCHSNQSVWPWYSNIAPVSWLVYSHVVEGRSYINFSDWNRPEGQTLDEVQEIYSEGSMPPADYLMMHPAARLSAEERKTLFDGLQQLATQAGQ